MQTQVQTSIAIPPAGIVVADSSARVRGTLAQAIRYQSDMRVVAAYETTEDTWRSLRQCQPEILLLDWRLPEAGAMTLLRRLGPGSDLNVILLTEEKNPDVLAQAMILGARGAISGSSRPETVLRCARAVLAGELWFSRRVTRALRDHIVTSAPRQFFPVLEEILTRRETDVVQAISRGRTNQQIAAELGISSLTVRHHLKAVFGKVHVSSRLELALLAVKNRL